jgi:polar amino acid transport system substrate-binding protein
MTGRVDLWLFDNMGVFVLARQQGIDPSELELVLPFRRYQSYVAISKSTPQVVAKRWQSILDAMVQDGTFFNISRRWLPLTSIPDFSEANANPTGISALKIYTEDSPPGSYVKDGQPVGFAVDVVREILRRLKHPDTITVVPWSRGYTLAQNAPGVALFSTTRMAAREQLFHWVGPLYSQTWAFYGRKGAGIRIDSLAQAREVRRIGTYLKDAKAQYLQDRGFDNLVSANRNISNIRHLVDGKLDLWVSSDFNMPYLVRQAGFDPDDFEQVYAFQSVTNYIAFSLGTPPSIIHEWQQCLKDIKTDGTYAKIARKYNLQLTD